MRKHVTDDRRGERAAQQAPPHALGALLLLLLVGCAAPERRGEARAAPDEDLLALLPAGAEAVLDVETATLQGLPMRERLTAVLPEAVRALALDPLRDLEAIAVGVKGLGTECAATVVLGRGRPSWLRLSDALRAEEPGAQEADYHGVRLLEGRRRAAAMLTPRTAVLGDRAAVRQVVDNARGETGGLRAQAELMAALGKAPRARQGRPAVLGALLPPAPLRERLQQADLRDLGADADYVALALAAGDGIDLGIVAGFRALGAAQEAAQRLRERAAALGARPLLAAVGLRPYLEPLIIVAAMGGPRRSEPELHLAYRLPAEDLKGLMERLARLPPLPGGSRARGEQAGKDQNAP